MDFFVCIRKKEEQCDEKSKTLQPICLRAEVPIPDLVFSDDPVTVARLMRTGFKAYKFSQMKELKDASVLFK